MFGLKRIVLEGVEHRREIALASVWQQHDDALALVLWTLSHLNGSIEGSSGRDTYQQTFLLGYLATCADGIIVFYIKYLVNDISIVRLGNETSSDALNLVRTALSAVQHW